MIWSTSSFVEGAGEAENEGMSVKVIVGQECTEQINVCNGLCQGCTMAPVLLSLYFGAVME